MTNGLPARAAAAPTRLLRGVGGRREGGVNSAMLAGFAIYNSRDVWSRTPDRYISATFLVFLALIIGGILAARAT